MLNPPRLLEQHRDDNHHVTCALFIAFLFDLIVLVFYNIID